jgi:two-component system, OmpR family, sensor kinase
MTRNFLKLYALVLLAIAGISWTQERLWFAYGNHDAYDKAQATTLILIQKQLASMPEAQRSEALSNLAASTSTDLELLNVSDIAGDATLTKLRNGEIVSMHAGRNEVWLLKQIDNSVIAFKQIELEVQRGALEWLLASLLYAGIALVVMIWLWPLTRDLRALEQATASFGNRNWSYRANIKPRSQVFALAETFRKMATRIDGLIGSHKDMSNAVAHEIKTPLARMQFTLELAQNAATVDAVLPHLQNIKSDIADLNALVRATLDYAILERADFALNIATHDFTKILPAIADYVRADTRTELNFNCDVEMNATLVECDIHLMESAIKNLLYNASRYAKQTIALRFAIDKETYRLTIEDDGPGIPESERERVFSSFVQLEKGANHKGFGLGLAIVKRIVEWHGGHVAISQSSLGGACFTLTWPK